MALISGLRNQVFFLATFVWSRVPMFDALSELASVCYGPHIDVGNTDLGWCGVDYAEANCWRVIKAPRDNHVLLKWDNIRKPSTERLNVYDYQDGEWCASTRSFFFFLFLLS